MGKQGSSGQNVTCNYSATEDRGRTLHREFVGMVFALAIAQVATEGAPIANVSFSWGIFPAFTHLALATLVITTSWVGWGRSEHSESNIKSVFAWDFVELLVDLWLVSIYFFIVKGVEISVTGKDVAVNPSLENEAFWLCVALGTYVAWDVITKWGTPDLKQRTWASALCAIFGFAAYWFLPTGEIEKSRAVLGDVALAFLLLLFRAMKMGNYDDLTWKNRRWMGCMLLLFALFASSLYVTVACY
jgi:hypothetical protein